MPVVDAMGDPHSYLFSNNVVPSAVEAASIELEVAELTNAICKLRSQLQERRRRLRQRLGVLSSVRRIPLEILGEIFNIALPALSDRQGRAALLKVCLVCRAWRDAALLKHRLWSRIQVDLDTGLSYEKVVAWHRRSGGIRRALFVIAGCRDSHSADTPCQLQHPTLAKLLTEGLSLDHISIDNIGQQCFGNMLASLADRKAESPALRPWDSIRSLALAFRRGWNESGNALEDSAFLRIPSSVSSFKMTVNTFTFPLDLDTRLRVPPSLLARLTTIHFSCDWDVTQLATALRYCINVQKLTICYRNMARNRDPVDPIPTEFSGPGFVLPNLHTLNLCEIPTAVTEVFQFLRAPALTELRIQFDRGDWLYQGELAPALKDFVKKSKCEATLRSFCLKGVCLVTEELADILWNFPFVTKLTLDLVDPFDSTSSSDMRRCFSLLLRPPEDTSNLPLLPRLEVLQLLGVRPEFPLHEVFDFLGDRRALNGTEAQPDTLKRLKMTYRTLCYSPLPVAVDEGNNAQKLRRSGVSVSFGRSSP
ncbi:hypothetical protein EST38_g9443 [Candolleomyces aberdarensis]|uniref:F-box domain-containing protein n=1 Tax=Candolleomyces aberdarensis TaxID=2316362 RepID=A0A4Q2D9W8_9AGAR|nr:hypothetical protein EST38_g9443 [Candolleomyces aberdarensis]